MITDKILIFGAGRLALRLSEYFPDVVVLDKSVCDITNRDAVLSSLTRESPRIAINAAAVTSPGLCETDPGLAWRVNVFGARNVAVACTKKGVQSVHISSNWAVDPVNEYGSSKYASEYVGFDLSIRTCYYDEEYWMLSALGKGDQLSLVESDVFNPISIIGLLRVLEGLLARHQQGVVNVGVIDRVSHFDFGVLLARAFGLPTAQIVPTQTVNTPYEYPFNTYLEPHPLSRISIVEDIREFRDTTDWQYASGAVDDRQEVQDLRSGSRGDSRLRSDASGGRFR